VATKIFTIANQKGGVGKTTTAINLAVGLARSKVPTLLIDLDPQGNATSGLGFEKKPGGSLYGPLHGEVNVYDQILETREKNLSFIPAEVDLAAIEVELGQKENYLLQLRKTLQPLREKDDFAAIILDCPPALGMLSMNSLVAADYLLIALQCEYLAMEGLGQILKVVEELKTAGSNPDLEVGGIILTLFDVRTKLCRQVVEEVKKYFKQLIFKTIIARSVRLSEAPSHGKSIFEYDPRGAGTLAYQNLTREVIKRFQLQ
jgi:chromosome partitioning protein